MSAFSVDWDIDSYYDDTEPQEHWELRKTFMETHKDKFPEEYLVALSKVFANVEFLGCKYSEPLMTRISELSKDVATRYRALKAKRLQRTFVTPSVTANQKRTGGRAETPRHSKN